MDLSRRDSQKSEHADDVGNALIQMAEENLDLTKWRFRLAFTKFDQTSAIKVIFDSEWCRFKLSFSRQRTPQQDELTIKYGRLHALNEDPYIEWRGERCHCWHLITEPLRFLDGLSPIEALEQVKIQKKSPVAIESFRQSELGKRLFAEYPPKAALVMHARIWEHYGQRLFELFDLRRPDLWEQYRSFLWEYYRLMGRKSSWGPPYENVC